MRPGLMFDGASEALQQPLSPGRGRLAVFAGLGLAAYVVAVVASLPAAVALRWSGSRAMAAQATGSVWNGALDLGPAGVVSWRLAPLRSMGTLAVAADVVVLGPGSDLTGRGQWRPGRLVAEGIGGVAGWPLVERLAPNLPFRCDLGFRTEIRRLVLAGARSEAVGELRSGPGVCAAKAAPDSRSALPPLVIVATADAMGSKASVAAQARPSVALAQASISADGRLTGVVHAAGAALLPPGALRGEVSFETRL